VSARGSAASFWLLKSEPEDFSWDDLMKAKGRTTGWSGVRNYQARNSMRDGMKVGDRAFFYHSSADPTGIVGVVEVVRTAYPDPTQFDKSNDMDYDPKSKKDAPTWIQVDVRAVSAFEQIVTLAELRDVKGLEKMVLLQRGSRLSVQPVTAKEWDIICRHAGWDG
jgi:predicted RNA-binding protein with PUA-like domain